MIKERQKTDRYVEGGRLLTYMQSRMKGKKELGNPVLAEVVKKEDNGAGGDESSGNLWNYK